MKGHEEILLDIPQDVRRLMDDRLVTGEDIQKVIYHAETTGEKFFNPSTGRSLASLRPGRVTYWVEYGRLDEGYRIYSAYSHRMEMKRGRGW
jgi:hypothetical protein